MHVSSKLRGISAAACVALLCACQPTADTAPQAAKTKDVPSLYERLGEVKVDIGAFEDLPGETRAEKLLYQSGVVSQMKTVTLVMFDTQIQTIEVAGNAALAEELRNTQDELSEAMEESLDVFIADAAKIYESYLTSEEIERLIALHSDPAMQKLIQVNPKISQDIIPAATAFGERASIRYEALVAAKKKLQKKTKTDD